MPMRLAETRWRRRGDHHRLYTRAEWRCSSHHPLMTDLAGRQREIRSRESHIVRARLSLSDDAILLHHVNRMLTIAGMRTVLMIAFHRLASLTAPMMCRCSALRLQVQLAIVPLLITWLHRLVLLRPLYRSPLISAHRLSHLLALELPEWHRAHPEATSAHAVAEALEGTLHRVAVAASGEASVVRHQGLASDEAKLSA